MADADDFDVESLRSLLRGETPEAAPKPAPQAAGRSSAKKPETAKKPGAGAGRAAAKRAPAARKTGTKKPVAKKPGARSRAGR